jgi:hypothetical protein
MIVGLKGVGKSCTFNWILNRPVIGKGDKIETTNSNICKDPSNADPND